MLPRIIHFTVSAWYTSVVPAQPSSSNGTCKVHEVQPTVCRPCLVEHLQEFRHANMRAGIRLTVGRISSLLDQYTSWGATQVSAATVVRDLSAVLAALKKANQQVKGLPVDAGVMISAMRKARSNSVWAIGGRRSSTATRSLPLREFRHLAPSSSSNGWSYWAIVSTAVLPSSCGRHVRSRPAFRAGREA